ncbi:hypothetical protein BC828DRAFT_112741 [Blastocladiella britannica]|nr:hypothetical protein BC828DRAFT_112741 [Blastocladiella britannica]
MAKVGESVALDEIRTTIVRPFTMEWSTICVTVYMTNDRDPKVVTSARCRQLGSITLPVDTSKGENQPYEVLVCCSFCFSFRDHESSLTQENHCCDFQFKFGTTEIKTQFKNVATGQVKHVMLEFA